MMNDLGKTTSLTSELGNVDLAIDIVELNGNWRGVCFIMT